MDRRTDNDMHPREKLKLAFKIKVMTRILGRKTPRFQELKRGSGSHTPYKTIDLKKKKNPGPTPEEKVCFQVVLCCAATDAYLAQHCGQNSEAKQPPAAEKTPLICGLVGRLCG